MTHAPSTSPLAIEAGSFRGGRLRVPGSKSITQRYFNLAFLQRSQLDVRGPLLSDDIRFFLGGMEKAGFAVTEKLGDVLLEPKEPPQDETEIFCGAGGTMFRFMTAALTAVPGTYTLDGIPRLRERTVAPLVDCLRQLGGEIEYLAEAGFAPLRIRGETLRGGRATLDAGISSQFLSAVLMAALNARGPMELEVLALTSAPYVDLTLDAMALFGASVEQEDNVFRVSPAKETALVDVEVEPDFSAAAYPASAAALTGREVHLDGLRRDSRQGDRAFLDLLAEMGAEVKWNADGVVVRGTGTLQAVEADLSSTPDQVPTLAALAPFARGTTRILNVPHLRIKESDRLAAMATELQRLGAVVEELPDGLVIEGSWADAEPPSARTEVDTWGDHRIAMSLALTGLRRPGVVIRDPGVVAKSYPAFWEDLASLG